MHPPRRSDTVAHGHLCCLRSSRDHLSCSYHLRICYLHCQRQCDTNLSV